MAQLPLVLVYHGPLRSHLLGVASHLLSLRCIYCRAWMRILSSTTSPPSPSPFPTVSQTLHPKNSWKTPVQCPLDLQIYNNHSTNQLNHQPINQHQPTNQSINTNQPTIPGNNSWVPWIHSHFPGVFWLKTTPASVPDDAKPPHGGRAPSTSSSCLVLRARALQRSDGRKHRGDFSGCV